MFLNLLLFYIIFIISVSKVDVLLGEKQNETELSEAEVKVLKSIKTKNRFKRPTKKLKFGDKKVKEFNEDQPANRVGDKKKHSIRNFFQRSQKYEGVRIERELKRYSLSNKIWHHVWDKCNRIECYSQNNFAMLYGKFLEEMNLYRKFHGCKPLEVDGRLNRIAMAKAENSAAIGRLTSSIKYDVGENSAICNSLYAPLTVYNWYRESSMHNYKTTAPLPLSQHFSNLIWKSATKVGIGIAKKANLLFIFVEFWPPYKQNFNIEENVLKPRYHCETEVRSDKSRSLKERINIFPKRTENIHFGEERVKTLDKNDLPNKVDRKNRHWVLNPSKPKQKRPKHKEFKVEKYLKKYSFSNRIWHRVWNTCKRIDCYSHNNFQPLYGRFVEEANFYRRVHGSRPLQMDVKLTRLAIERARKSAKLGKLISSPISDIRENSIVCHKLYAPLTIYMWYNEVSKHNYKTFVALPNTMHFSNLIWKNATKVGIGIAKRNSFLYIFVLFWPETNRKFKFRENVLKPRYHWYNYRGLFEM
uniref:SCP domain-containing protein n=1 Tax=Strongyloides papillosus TaxID=174720 RepID=A0A0N5B292_STREA